MEQDYFVEMYATDIYFRRFIDHLATRGRSSTIYQLRSIMYFNGNVLPRQHAMRLMTLLNKPYLARILENGTLEFLVHPREFAKSIIDEYNLLHANNDAKFDGMQPFIDDVMNGVRRLLLEAIEKHSGIVG